MALKIKIHLMRNCKLNQFYVEITECKGEVLHHEII